MFPRLAPIRPLHVALAFVFLLLFCGLAFKNPYYLPTTLVIHTEAGPEVLSDLAWDSGEGFNAREHVAPASQVARPEAKAGGTEYRYPVPQIPLRALRISFSAPLQGLERIEARSANGTVPLQVSQQDPQTFVVRHADLQNRRPHAFLLTIQALVALLLSCGLSLLWGYLAPRRRLGVRAVLSEAFYSNERYVFWGMFAGALVVFGVWLVGQWPGIMTVDSYHFTWREIKTLQLTGITPWVYNAYVLALIQLADTPVVVPLFQITMTAWLGALFLFFCYRHGAAKWLVALSYLAFITSIPVGLFNLVLWKDIPFCLTMLAWAGLLYFLRYRLAYHGVTYRFRMPTLVALAASLLFLATVRHNGIIFLVAIPAILLLFRLMSRPDLIRFTALTALGFLTLTILTPRVIIGSQTDVKQFFAKTYRVAPLAAIYTSKHFYSPNHEQDWEVVNKWIPRAELQEIYTPTAQADQNVMMIRRWMALEPKDQAYLNRLYLERSLQNPHLFAADRTAMFLGTMGFAENLFIIVNELFGTDRSYWRPIESYRLHPKTWAPALSDASKELMARLMTPGWKRSLIFNSLPALLLLLATLLAYKYVPVTALFSFVFLYNLPFLFLVLSTCEWRYFYFLVLASYFLLPLMSAERAARRGRATSGVDRALPAPALV